jgi:D-3-phosphoglycerate dehydrogenase
MKIKIFNKIAHEGLNLVENRIRGAQLGSDINSPDAIVLRSHKLKLEECDGVIAVARAGAGVNNVPVQELSERGVIVFNTPGANANAVAELTLGAMIADARNMHEAHNYFDFNESPPPKDLAAQVEKDKKEFKGVELRGKKIVIFGLGAIGSAVARLALAFGMQVIGNDPYAACVEGSEVVEDWQEWRADYYTFHAPVTSDTKKLASKVLEVAQRDNATILNFSRGELFDNSELIQALNKGARRYITDFAHNEFIEMGTGYNSKVVCYPHLGASTEEAETNCSLMATEQLCDLWEYGAIKNSVNFPHLPLAIRDRGATRVLFLHRNEPGVLKAITSQLADMSANVVDMTNRAKGEYAATLVDFDGASSVVSALESKPISGVLSLFKVVGHQP